MSTLRPKTIPPLTADLAFHRSLWRRLFLFLFGAADVASPFERQSFDWADSSGQALRLTLPVLSLDSKAGLGLRFFLKLCFLVDHSKRTPMSLAAPTEVYELPLSQADASDLRWFRVFYDAQAPFVRRAVLRLGGPTADADDLLQEIFLVAHRRWPALAGTVAPRAWLYGVAVRVVASARRRERVKRVFGLASERIDSETPASVSSGAKRAPASIASSKDSPKRSARSFWYRQLQRRLQRPPSLWREAVPPFAIAAAISLVVVIPLALRHRQAAVAAATRTFAATAVPQAPAPEPTAAPQSGARVIDLGPIGRLELSRAAELALPSGPPNADGYRVQLARGAFCAEVAHRDLPREGPFIVEAPGARVVVIGTHFCVDVSADDGIATVSVSQGRVRVDAPSGAMRYVGAGEAVRGEPPPAIAVPIPSIAAPLLPVAAPPRGSDRCVGLADLRAREDCFGALSAGDDLVAQNALFSLGLLARDARRDSVAAASFFRASLARFPEGVLAPEAAEELILALAHAGRAADARVALVRYRRQLERGHRTVQVEAAVGD